MRKGEHVSRVDEVAELLSSIYQIYKKIHNLQKQKVWRHSLECFSNNRCKGGTGGSN